MSFFQILQSLNDSELLFVVGDVVIETGQINPGLTEWVGDFGAELKVIGLNL